jgi:endonuclease/exonuclease/phosphatase family metal-dependent hydrolase
MATHGHRHLPLILALTLIAPVALWGGCSEPTDTSPDAGTPPTEPAKATLHVATWNLKQFPATSDAPARMAEALQALDADVIAVQEVADPAAFQTLLNAMPGYQGVLGRPQAGNTPIRVGLLWRTSTVALGKSEELFTSSPLFPRPALRADFGVAGVGAHFSVMTVHLKAGTTQADEQQRIDSARVLVGQLAEIQNAGEDEVLLLGDFNEAFGDRRAAEFFGIFEGDAGHTVLSRALQQSGQVTFIPAKIVLDHMVSTPGLKEEIGTSTPSVVTGLATPSDGGTALSDHHPVRLELSFSKQQ